MESNWIPILLDNPIFIQIHLQPLRITGVALLLYECTIRRASGRKMNHLNKGKQPVSHVIET